MSTSRNDDRGPGGTRSRSNSLDSLNNIHTFNDRAENDVLTIQPSSFDGTQEELRSVGVGASVSHRKDTGASVLENEVLIFEFVSLYVIKIMIVSCYVGEISPSYRLEKSKTNLDDQSIELT